MRESAVERALRLVVEISAAPADPDRWLNFVRLLADDLGGAAIGLTLEIPNIGESRLVYRHNLDPAYNTLTARAIAQNESPWRMEGLTDAFVYTSASYPGRPISDVPYYRDCLIPQGVAPELPIGHVFARRNDRDLAAIIIYRREGCRKFDAADLEMLNLLVPHLDNAYSAYDVFRGMDEKLRAFSALVYRFPAGIVLLNSEGGIVEMNETTQRVLEEEDGVRVVAGRLRATDPQADRLLQAQIQRALGSGKAAETAADDPVAIERRSGQRPFAVLVSRLVGQRDWWAPDSASVVLFISDPEYRKLPIRGMLMALYDLTGAEADLAALLCEGNSVQAAAIHRKESISTVRGQLKSVFEKTNTQRQGDLVALALAGFAGLPAGSDDA